MSGKSEKREREISVSSAVSGRKVLIPNAVRDLAGVLSTFVAGFEIRGVDPSLRSG